jgi:glycosyltransferase involved in cell wall biosynthesis
MNAPRVLVVGSVLSQPMGGVRRHNQEFLPRAASLLRERGGALSVLAGRDGLALDPGPQIEVLSSSAPAQPAALRAAFESSAVQRALREARERGAPFDLVHTAHLPAPRSLDAPFTLTLHDLKSVLAPGEGGVRRFVGRCLLQDALKRAQRVLAVSRTLCDELREHLGARPEQLTHAPNGCDHLPLEPRRPAADAALLFVGHLEPRKNLGLLLRALALAPDLGRLQLAGAPKGDERAELERLARELGIAARVEFLGLLSDAELARHYASCRAVVLPSLREGFDIPLVEALRAGAPLACSDLAVHRELAGPHASYFDPRSPQALAAAVREARAPREAPQLATWDDTARAYVACWISAARPRA